MEATDIQFNIDWLKKNHQMIHYFGLGFVQLKIDEQFRIHFYTPELPPITPDEDIHNHRYDFESYILKGKFQQELFHVAVGNTHVCEEESCKEGIHSKSEGKTCGIALAGRHQYQAGSSYWLSHATFHRVKADNCVTLLKRSDYKKELAEVIRPVEGSKVCPFSQKIEDEKLWTIVDKMIGE